VDDASVIQSAIDAVEENGGGGVLIRQGLYIIQNSIIMKSRIVLHGEGMRNTRLKLADGADTSVISYPYEQTGDYALGSLEIAHLWIDGNKANNTQGFGIIIAAWDAVFHHLFIRNCAKTGFFRKGATSASTDDNTIYRVRVVDCDGYGIHCSSSGTCIMDCYIGNNAWSGISFMYEGTKIIGNTIYGSFTAIEGHRSCESAVITGNTIDVRAGGRGILINAGEDKLDEIIISNNIINVKVNAKEGICIKGVDHPVRVNIRGNIIKAYRRDYSPTLDYGILCEGDVRGHISDNIILQDNATITTPIEPASCVVGSNLIYWDLLTRNSGTATFSGDGTTTQFSIAHGLVKAPTKVLVTPMTADAASDFYVTADDTNIYINYKSAPPSGTDNLKFSWYAEV